MVLASLCPKRGGRQRSGSSLYGSGRSICSEGETRCSAVWSAHLFWVQRAIGSNPVTLMWYSHNGAEVQSPVAYPWSGRQAKSAHKRKRKLKSLFCNPLSGFWYSIFRSYYIAISQVLFTYLSHVICLAFNQNSLSTGSEDSFGINVLLESSYETNNILEQFRTEQASVESELFSRIATSKPN